ncbi:conserved hypothetical protein [Streptomyces sviceus ATCC 29083]|uniref:Uncharacterized protein n=2 Tax=Streptomyces TaxID=1883 RepID=B5HS66_STRX2|nr:conserved hypothetical protein [Streptomyces sviceus ATCC 29083]
MGGEAETPPPCLPRSEDHLRRGVRTMSQKRLSAIILVVVLVFVVVTLVALGNPALGVAISAGVAVATLVWKMLHAK